MAAPGIVCGRGAGGSSPLGPSFGSDILRKPPSDRIREDIELSLQQSRQVIVVPERLNPSPTDIQRPDDKPMRILSQIVDARRSVASPERTFGVA